MSSEFHDNSKNSVSIESWKCERLTNQKRSTSRNLPSFTHVEVYKAKVASFCHRATIENSRIFSGLQKSVCRFQKAENFLNSKNRKSTTDFQNLRCPPPKRNCSPQSLRYCSFLNHYSSPFSLRWIDENHSRESSVLIEILRNFVQYSVCLISFLTFLVRKSRVPYSRRIIHKYAH